MNFILQTINCQLTLDMCFQMERAKEYWDCKNPDDTFDYIYAELEDFEDKDFFVDHITKSKYNGEECSFNPEEWCPVGTVEFVEKYLRTYFSDEIADNAMKPLNVPDCFLDNCRFECGRYIWNTNLEDGFDEDNEIEYYIKDNLRIKNPNNGVMTLKEAYDKGLRNVQVSTLIRNNKSEWRIFVHNGDACDIKCYDGNPFVFPNGYTIINCYVHHSDINLKEGTIDVYVDLDDNETYVMECHKFFSCGLYGFDHPDILPIMYWRTYKELIK